MTKDVTDGAKVFIKNKNTGKYLFMLRDDNPEILYPGMWCLLGGGIEEGETPLEALERELKEEINIKVSKVNKIGTRKLKISSEGKELRVTGHFFLAYTDKKIEEIDVYEGRGARYFSLEEIKNHPLSIPTLPKTIEVFEKYLI